MVIVGMASGGTGAGPTGAYGDRLSRITVRNIGAGLAPPPAYIKAGQDEERDERALRRQARIEELARVKDIAGKENREEMAANATDRPAAAAAAAPMAPPCLRAILGHGFETEPNFLNRSRLPAGITLVTIVKYGEFAVLPEPCNGVQLFSNPANRDILRNPAANIDAISGQLYTPEQMANGRRIRVYRPGDRYPTLGVIPLADWSKTTKDRSPFMLSFISGLRDFPIAIPARPPFSITLEPALLKKIQETEMFKRNDHDIQCSSLLFYRKTGPIDRELIDSLYTGSLYPTREAASAYIGKPVQILKHELTTPISTLFRDPGVYYFFICRDTRDNLAAECDNFFRLAFSLDERETETDDYKQQMFNFREQYSNKIDHIEKIGYFLNVLNGLTPIITFYDTGKDLYMSNEVFVKAANYLVCGKKDLLPGNLYTATGLNRKALEESPTFYADHREKVGVGGRMRSNSNAAAAAAAGGGGGGGAAGGAGGGAAAHWGGRRRLRKTKKGRRKSTLSRKRRY